MNRHTSLWHSYCMWEVEWHGCQTAMFIEQLLKDAEGLSWNEFDEKYSL